MFATFGKKAVRNGESHSVIDTHTEIRGPIKSRGMMEIRGRVVGDIEHDGSLVVASGACCVSNIRATQLEIAGEVRGEVEVTGKLIIQDGGCLHGDAMCGSLVVQAGGALNGRNRMYTPGDRKPEKAEPPALPQPQPVPQAAAAQQAPPSPPVEPVPAEVHAEHATETAQGEQQGFKGWAGLKPRTEAQNPTQ